MRGMSVSQLCLGTWYLPSSGVVDKDGHRIVDREAATKLINRAIDLGINFFDTANIYHGTIHRPQGHPGHTGNSEKILGSSLSGVDRESVVVGTKVRGEVERSQGSGGLSRKHISWQIQESLKRLQMKYVDLYQLHWEDNSTPHLETMSTLDDLVSDGMVRYIGVCNHTARNMKKMQNLASRRRLVQFTTMQERYNLVHREIEKEKVALARKYGMQLLCYSPIAGGILSGKYINGTPVASRGFYNQEVAAEARQLMNHAKCVRDIAQELDITPTQVALSWLLRMQSKLGIVVVPIIGATSIEHLEQNVAAVDINLPQDCFTRLTQLDGEKSRTVLAD